MKLCDPLPISVEVEGKTYKLTPAFDNVLQMFEQTDDDDLSDTEKAELMLYYLTDNAPLDARILMAACKALFPEVKGEATQKAFDFVQDAELIYAAFWQTYGIDLFEQQGKLHWCKFFALFQGLPENTRFREVVAIRLRPLPEPTKHNAKERQQLLKAKHDVALKVTDAERQKNLQDGLKRMALMMMGKGKIDG